MKKFILYLFGILGLIIIIGVVIILLSSPFEKTEYSNCVVASTESNFIGKYLKNDGYVNSERILTSECIRKDMDLDSGNGEKLGVVRWVVCLKGPDCDEAGNY